jgi:hypothetical protein
MAKLFLCVYRNGTDLNCTVSGPCVEYWVARDSADDFLCLRDSDQEAFTPTMSPQAARQASAQLLAVCDWAESDVGKVYLDSQRPKS